VATCLDIITYAMRQCKILGLGKEPKAAESQEGMVALQSLYDEWRTGGMFGELEDIYLDGNDIAEEGKRYFVPTGITLTAATSIYDDGGLTRQPRDLALYETLTEAGTQTAKLYDRTAWVDLLGLELSDIAPLSLWPVTSARTSSASPARRRISRRGIITSALRQLRRRGL
jgi:hypothetical protein